MNIEELREYCLAKKGTEESLPFGPDTLVIKVMNKMFALIALESSSARINLKCDPERALDLREQYPSIIPGYHMNKQHWNTVICDGAASDDLIRELIDHSYDLIVASLKKADQEKLKNL